MNKGERMREALEAAVNDLRAWATSVEIGDPTVSAKKQANSFRVIAEAEAALAERGSRYVARGVGVWDTKATNTFAAWRVADFSGSPDAERHAREWADRLNAEGRDNG